MNTLNRENILKFFLDEIKKDYDYIIIDCLPSLGMLTINALAAADSVIIPVQAQYLSLKGLELLIDTISKIKKRINPNIKIEGILITMLDSRTSFSKIIAQAINESYGNEKINDINRFETSGQVVQKLSRDEIAKVYNENGRQVHRYIRLNELIEPLLEFVDNEVIPFTVGVELSYLNKQQQVVILEYFFENYKAKMDLKTANVIKEVSKNMDITEETLDSLFCKNIKSKIKKSVKIPYEKFNGLLDDFNDEKQVIEYIIKAIEFYKKSN